MTKIVLEDFIKNEPYISDGLVARTLPKSKISKIILIHNTGALSGGSSGSLIANTILRYIKLRVDGKEFISWNGEADTDKVPYGIQMLREFEKQKTTVGLPNEYFVINLPDALPDNVRVDIEVQFNAIGNINDGDRTAYTGTLDIKYEVKDKILGSVVVPFITWGKFNHSNKTGKFLEYLTALPYPLRLLIFITEDNGTLANDTYDNIRMTMPASPIFNGSPAVLRAEHEAKSKVALTTGFFMKFFKDGLRVPSDTFLIEFEASTAGTDKEVHWIAIAY